MAHVNMHTADREGRLENWQDVPLTLALIDLGGTLAAEVWAGPSQVARFLTHTGHPDRAFEAASDVLAAALRPLIEQAAHAHSLTVLPPDA